MAAEIDKRALGEQLVHLCRIILSRTECYQGSATWRYEHPLMTLEGTMVGAGAYYAIIQRVPPHTNSGLGRIVLEKTSDGNLLMHEERTARELLPIIERLAVLDLLADIG